MSTLFNLPPSAGADVLFNLEFCTQAHAEDVLMFHRFSYYVLGRPVWPDKLYDQAEALVKTRFPWSGVVRQVGSSNRADYPGYITDGRRPTAEERKERDCLIAQFKELFA